MIDLWVLGESLPFRPAMCKVLSGITPVCPRSSPAANHSLTIPLNHIKMSECTVPLACILPHALDMGNQVILKFYWVIMVSCLFTRDMSCLFLRRWEGANSQKRILIRILGWFEDIFEPDCFSLKSYHLNDCPSSLSILIWGHDVLI